MSKQIEQGKGTDMNGPGKSVMLPETWEHYEWRKGNVRFRATNVRNHRKAMFTRWAWRIITLFIIAYFVLLIFVGNEMEISITSDGVSVSSLWDDYATGRYTESGLLVPEGMTETEYRRMIGLD